MAATEYISSVLYTHRHTQTQRRNTQSVFAWISKPSAHPLDLKSKVLCLGHNGEPARPRVKVSSPSLLVRGRSNQRGESSLHEISFDAANSHERVRHRGSARVEAVRRVRRRSVALLVEAATEGARVRRRRAHAGPLLLVVRATALP